MLLLSASTMVMPRLRSLCAVAALAFCHGQKEFCQYWTCYLNVDLGVARMNAVVVSSIHLDH